MFWSTLISIGISLYHGKNLLTVAAGFLGKALITDLLSKTVEVMALIRQSSAELPLVVGHLVVCDLAKTSAIGLVTSIVISDGLACFTAVSRVGVVVIFLSLWEEGSNYLIIKPLNGLAS